MTPAREMPGGGPVADSSELMRNLIWAPDYQDADAWFSPAPGTTEGVVIREPSAWPTTLAGLGPGETVPASSGNAVLANLTVPRCAPLPHRLLRDLLDVRSGRFVGGYLGVSRSLPAAHLLCLALASDSHRWIQRHLPVGDSMSMTGMATLRMPARRFWRDAITWGPFEFLVVIGFLFETCLADRLECWGFHSHAAWSARRASLGRKVLGFILDQHPSNRQPVQSWLDRGTSRCADFFGCADDAFLAANADSAGNERRHEGNPLLALKASFADLASHGIEPPASLAGRPPPCTRLTTGSRPFR